MARNTAAAQPEETPQSRKRRLRPIDLVHLAKQCLGDEALELEILQLFDTTIATYYGRLQDATTPEEVAMNLHAIKGAASGVGAWAISEMAAALESDHRAGQDLSVEQIDDLGLAVEDVRGFIARLLAGQPE
ncbi:MAG: Hpt domain-containing protein [Devosia sp.]|jgi:HPt (histidine-containing phosphotransfer) domain-containing protein|uniref:Hpt domain-containing protein n=1 Tax=Devosia sp. TaxID=1871048 RepID=UPI0019EEC4B7|nr:Hpt domain-containing protein [Devosia sp.]MBF0679288.1 Hpt domain-containing protein [Devosia sp.]